MQTINRNKRLIIIGDVHGCLDELKELILALSLTTNDSIYFIGDLIDRGPDTIGTIKFIYTLSNHFNVIKIIGNHEEKFLRYLEKKNELNNDIFNEYLTKLSEQEINFLKDSYYNYYIPEHDIMLIHGGYLSKIELKKGINNKYINRKNTNFSILTMTRFIDPTGRFIEFGKNDDTSIFWAKKYNGQVGKVVFGHNYFKQNGPYYFEHAIGIDNGCVYGGWLTALIIDAHSNISSLSVQSNQIY